MRWHGFEFHSFDVGVALKEGPPVLVARADRAFDRSWSAIVPFPVGMAGPSQLRSCPGSTSAWRRE